MKGEMTFHADFQIRLNANEWSETLDAEVTHTHMTKTC